MPRTRGSAPASDGGRFVGVVLAGVGGQLGSLARAAQSQRGGQPDDGDVVGEAVGVGVVVLVLLMSDEAD